MVSSTSLREVSLNDRTTVSPLSAAKSSDEEWLATTYAGEGTPQLTLRAVLMGLALGSLMSMSNLYVGLKIGWSLGVAITSCILSYAIFRLVPSEWLQAPRWLPLFDRHRERHVTILENNCMQSTASAAGYGTGATRSRRSPPCSCSPARVLPSGRWWPWSSSSGCWASSWPSP